MLEVHFTQTVNYFSYRGPWLSGIFYGEPTSNKHSVVAYISVLVKLKHSSA